MSDDELNAMEADAKRVGALRAESHWMNTPPPWKAVGTPCGEPGEPNRYGTHWTITNDAGDTREEYDVFESPDEGLAKWVAEMPVLMPALAAHILSLTEEVRRLREENESLKMEPSIIGADRSKYFDFSKWKLLPLTEPDLATIPTRLDTNPPCVFMPGSVATE